MKNNYHITSYRDLVREEKLVRDRIQQQETEIKLQVKKLPEEVVLLAINRVISTVASTSILSIGNMIVRSVLSYFTGNAPSDKNESGKTIQRVVSNILERFFHKNHEE
ncbi:MAG: hypothetical protein K0Q95_331 [Bacteroidota bacterium]|nr:hypothetical protein [Bacteroidota bacterium]